MSVDPNQPPVPPVEEPQSPAPSAAEIDYEKLAAALAPKIAELGGTASNKPQPQPVEEDAVSAQQFGHGLREQLPVLPETGHAAEPTLGVGMAGEAVHELAKLAEACGVETYLQRGDNPAHVFTDELLRSIRALVGDRRGFVSAIDADIWRLLRHKAAQAA